ncbi:MAG: VOC family protein [Pseudomonadota bacterium]
MTAGQTSETGRVLIRGHGFPVDHIALAVPNTERSVCFVEEKTGVRPTLTQRDRKDFYWSAALGIGEDNFLEVIGPNPDHRGIHPLKSIMARLKRPTPLFGYVATDDFEGFAARVRATGAPVTNIAKVDPDTSANGSDFTRGAIGPGFLTQRPGFIEWRRRSIEQSPDLQCRLVGFSLKLPNPKALNSLFKDLALDVTIEQGSSLISITIETPKGKVTFENEGMRVTALRALVAILRRPFGWRQNQPMGSDLLCQFAGLSIPAAPKARAMIKREYRSSFPLRSEIEPYFANECSALSRPMTKRR